MTETMKNPKWLPIGEQDFETIRNEGRFYLDKTSQIHELLIRGSKYNFFSRPRRFGKSLMLSVMKNLFLGKKELFKDLFIYDKWEFEQYPVIHLSLAGYSQEEDLKEYINNKGRIYIKGEKTKFKDHNYFDFGELLEDIKNSTGKKVAVLIDEYDKPVLEHLQDIKKAERVRKIFSSFYSNVKDSDEYIKFFFLTGLTKLMKMSIFSTINNFKDISFSRKYNDLIGFTQTELEENFSEEIKVIAENYNMKYTDFLDRVKREYNGFNFGGTEPLYNPWDVNNLIDEKKLGNYWADTGMPSAVREFIHTTSANIQGIIDDVKDDKLMLEELDLRVQDLEDLRLDILLFNAGYLSISKEDGDIFYLKFPNNEAQQVMLRYFLKLSLKEKYNTKDWKEAASIISTGIFDKKQDELKKGMEYLLNDVLGNAYDWFSRNPEGWFKSMLGVALKIGNIYYVAENQSISGRTDIHIPRDTTAYVLELKVNDKAENCIKQIEEKYESHYKQSFEKVVKVGVNWKRKEEGKQEVDVMIEGSA